MNAAKSAISDVSSSCTGGTGSFGFRLPTENFGSSSGVGARLVRPERLGGGGTIGAGGGVGSVAVSSSS